MRPMRPSLMSRRFWYRMSLLALAMNAALPKPWPTTHRDDVFLFWLIILIGYLGFFCASYED